MSTAPEQVEPAAPGAASVEGNDGGPGAKPDGVARPFAPQPERVSAAELTLDQAEKAAARIVELIAELVAELDAVEDCAQFVPTVIAWETRHAEESETLEGVAWQIPQRWRVVELDEYFTKMDEHRRWVYDTAAARCPDDPAVRDAYGLDDDTDMEATPDVETTLPTTPVLPVTPAPRP